MTKKGIIVEHCGDMCISEQYSLTTCGKKVVRRIISFFKGYLSYLRGFRWLKR